MLKHLLHRAEKLVPAQKLLIVRAKEYLQIAAKSRKHVMFHKRDPKAMVAGFPSYHLIPSAATLGGTGVRSIRNFKTPSRLGVPYAKSLATTLKRIGFWL